MNLNYGCGLSVGKGWYNCDASPTLWLQRLPLGGALFRGILKPVFPAKAHFGDVVRGLPLPADSCDAIFCSHVLEHLSLEDCRSALRNTYAYLKLKGLFRLIVPDFEQQVATYLSTPGPAAVSEFLTYTHLGRKSRPRSLGAFLREYWGSGHHLWMWDYKGLAQELESAGFRGVRRCGLGDSANAAFAEVESAERFEWSLGIEATK